MSFGNETLETGAFAIKSAGISKTGNRRAKQMQLLHIPIKRNPV